MASDREYEEIICYEYVVINQSLDWKKFIYVQQISEYMGKNIILV